MWIWIQLLFYVDPDPALKNLLNLPCGEFSNFSGVEKDIKDCSNVQNHAAGPNLLLKLKFNYYQFPYIFSVFPSNVCKLNADPGSPAKMTLFFQNTHSPLRQIWLPDWRMVRWKRLLWRPGAVADPCQRKVASHAKWGHAAHLAFELGFIS